MYITRLPANCALFWPRNHDHDDHVALILRLLQSTSAPFVISQQKRLKAECKDMLSIFCRCRLHHVTLSHRSFPENKSTLHVCALAFYILYTLLEFFSCFGCFLCKWIFLNKFRSSFPVSVITFVIKFTAWSSYTFHAIRDVTLFSPFRSHCVPSYWPSKLSAAICLDNESCRKVTVPVV